MSIRNASDATVLQRVQDLPGVVREKLTEEEMARSHAREILESGKLLATPRSCSISGATTAREMIWKLLSTVNLEDAWEHS